MTPRLGVAGTGFWARTVHAPAVVASEYWDLVAVWGRNPDAASAIASDAPGEVTAYGDFDTFLDAVDAVTFALPPDVQAPLALRALDAGKHVLLEKPISLDPTDADALVAAAERSGAATAVFFTNLYDPRVRDIMAMHSPALRGDGRWLGSALTSDSPFNTPWRNIHGGLWDLGPHALAVMWTALGPIERVAADGGAGDLHRLDLTHTSGATSTVSVTLRAPDATAGFSASVWTERGRVDLPVDDVDSLAALTLALDELGECASQGRSDHPYDVGFGREIVRLLASAEGQVGR